LTWDELHFAHILIEERVLSDPDTARDAATVGDTPTLLQTAIQMEKDSVLFYRELLDEVDDEDRSAVREIIDEEKRHVCALIELQRKLSS